LKSWTVDIALCPLWNRLFCSALEGYIGISFIWGDRGSRELEGDCLDTKIIFKIEKQFRCLLTYDFFLFL